MTTKAAITKQFIIETSAPIFNKHGYAATSLSTLTKVTGLTKGAIYGNFENKEDLAIQAFNYNIGGVFRAIRHQVDLKENSVDKLLAIVDFYKDYLEYSKKHGGCPIINVGVDANNQNTKLLQHVRNIIQKIHVYIRDIIELGKQKGEIQSNISSTDWAIRIDSMIQGATFMAGTMNDARYLHEMSNQLHEIVMKQIKI
ncbi:TetR/AcrR family transcriptional regulator [Pseudotenacibaculum sp. MALMAid0570]|uniref:TetR/AcrR family transcriptional regulator n=1 Tax=Pseudotenacibaculum sp. MALMAid0570 TaxID=3143938 RepID=UPI0032DE88EA